MTDPNKQPEQLARENIDAALAEAGWVVQSRDEMNVAAELGVAIREFKTDAGFADYLLYVDRKPAGVIEAKREGTTLTGVEAQTKDYADRFPKEIPVPIRPLPFLYESTGVDTRFTNQLDPTPRSRRVFRFHQPGTLKKWLDDAIAIEEKRPDAPTAPTFLGRMQLAPPLNTKGMWPAQINAVQNLETSIKAGRPRALIQMATGSGKTYTAISALYRLVKFGGARRALFLVDRSNLGKQADTEFQAYTTPDDGRKFTKLYNVNHLTSQAIDPVNRVVITTIQRLYSILKGDPDFDRDLEEGSAFTGSGAALVRDPPPVVYSKFIPPEFFDVIVVDEAHRSIYSIWRQVLEYFDATIIGLTATPAKHTFAFFHKNVVSEYRHEHAVRDKVNVPFEVYEIRTRITEQGGVLTAKAGNDRTVVGRRDRLTRTERWEALDENLTYSSKALDRSVVAKDQIRTIVREFKDKLFTDIFPGRTEVPKTLFFAKNDSHAEDILEIVRQEFSMGNEEAVKVTYKPERRIVKEGKKLSASQKPDGLIKRFRNSYSPRIAVTVDMIATGTDIKPLECVVFMRSVKSRGLFEQMKGRGVRVIPDADFQAVTSDAKVKTHFVIVDCVGVMEDQKSDPPMMRERGLSLKKLLELVQAGSRDDNVLSTLAGRLDRIERQLEPVQKDAIREASGGSDLHTIVAGLINAIDADREDTKARELYDLPPDQEPSEEQVKVAQAELREAAASAIAYNAKLCQTIRDVRKEQEQTLVPDIDEVTRSAPAPQHAINYDKQLVDSFQTFIEKNRDEIDALQILYSKPYGEHLTRKQIKELALAIEKPPRQWTTEALWQAYEKIEKDKVRGSGGRLWTDIVALARHALHPDEDLVPFEDQVKERFTNWVAQQQNAGRTFTTEQMHWLEMIRDRIAGDAEVRIEDFDDVPFLDEGGLGKFYEAFGDDYETVVAELNAELVA